MSRPKRQAMALERKCCAKCYMNEYNIVSLRVKNAHIMANNSELMAKIAKLKEHIALLNNTIIQYEKQFIQNLMEFREYIPELAQQCQSNNKMTRSIECMRTAALTSLRINDTDPKKVNLFKILGLSCRTKEFMENKFQPTLTEIAEETEKIESEYEQNGSTRNRPATEVKSKTLEYTVLSSRTATGKENCALENLSSNKNTRSSRIRPRRAARSEMLLVESNENRSLTTRSRLAASPRKPLVELDCNCVRNIPATEVKSEGMKRTVLSKIPTKNKNCVLEELSPNQNTRSPRTRPIRAARPKVPLIKPNLVSKMRRY